MAIDVMYSSNREDWETPQDLFDSLNAEFCFTLDAAASAVNAKCGRFIDEAHDALSQEWDASAVWCNPPYGRKIGKFVAKAAEQSRKHHNTVVMLIPSRTDTRWFHSFIYNKPGVEIRFLKGRLRFGAATQNAPFPSMVVVFRGGSPDE